MPTATTAADWAAEPAPPRSGGEIICDALKANGVRTVFGYTGGAILHFYDALHRDAALYHVMVRHEQGAAHAATGYARASGRPGVCVATSGPGATLARRQPTPPWRPRRGRSSRPTPWCCWPRRHCTRPWTPGRRASATRWWSTSMPECWRIQPTRDKWPWKAGSEFPRERRSDWPAMPVGW